MNFENPFREENNRLLLKAITRLPSGWIVLQNAVLMGGKELPELRVEYVLAHSEFGVAILDILPTKATPDVAVQRMRRQLEVIGEAFNHAAPPPIVHIGLHHSKLPELKASLEGAFSHVPAMPVGHDESWVAALRSLLKATPLEPAPETKPAATPHAPPASAIGSLGGEHRFPFGRRLQGSAPFRFSGGAFLATIALATASVGAVLFHLAVQPELPASPLPSPPAVVAERTPPAGPREAQNPSDI